MLLLLIASKIDNNIDVGEITATTLFLQEDSPCKANTILNCNLSDNIYFLGKPPHLELNLSFEAEENIILYWTKYFKNINSIGNSNINIYNSPIGISSKINYLIQYGYHLSAIQKIFGEIKGVMEGIKTPNVFSSISSIEDTNPIIGFNIKRNTFELLSNISANIIAIHGGLSKNFTFINNISNNDPIKNNIIYKNTINLLNNNIIIINKLSKSIVEINKINNSILNTESLSSNIILKNGFLLLNENINIINTIAKKLLGNLSLKNEISNKESINGYLILKASYELLKNYMNYINSFNADVSDLITIKNTISSSIGNNFSLSILNNLSNLSNLIGIITNNNSLNDIEQLSFDNTKKYRIILDGQDITNIVTNDCVISIAQNNIHNTVSFSSISEKLYNMADPADKIGEMRIQIQLHNREFYFLLEERSGTIDNGNVEYWGRDITARDSNPYHNSIDIGNFDEPKLASKIVEDIFTYSAINWEIGDWLLPKTFNASGTPIEITIGIVNEIGAILRAQDDGSLTVRYQYPTRPHKLNSNVAYVYNYTPEIIYNVNFEKNIGGHYNKVDVCMESGDDYAPNLILEPILDNDGNQIDRNIGMDSYIRVYWSDSPSSDEARQYISTFVTDGKLEKIDGVFNDTFEQQITFNNGIANTNFPINDIISISWIGEKAEIISNKKYSTELQIDKEYAIAKITYTASYERYLAFGHFVELLLVVFRTTGIFNSSVCVTMKKIAKDKNNNLIDKIADRILVNNLSGENNLVKRGETWLDDNRYDFTNITFNSPYSDNVKDGNIAWYSSEKINSSYCHIIESSITLSHPKIENNMRIKKWDI